MDKTIDKQVRGGVVIALLGFVEERLDPAARVSVLESVPPELSRNLRNLERAGFYDYEYSNAVMRGITRTVPDPIRAYSLAREAAEFVANDAINTFLRLLVKFLKPAILARKFEDFFRKDHNFGRMQTDLSEVAKNRFVLTMSDVEGYEYVGAGAGGWMCHVLACMGCKNVEVRETLNPPPAPQTADNYRFEVTWS